MFVFELTLIVNIILKNLSVLSLSIKLIVFYKMGVEYASIPLQSA